jgi:hypothetical protein
VKGSRFRVQDLGFRVCGLGIKVWDSRYRIHLVRAINVGVRVLAPAEKPRV